MIPKRRRKERMGVREETRVRSESYKQWVRGFPCSVAHTATASRISQCNGPIQAAHVQGDDRVPYDERSAGKIKAGDNWVYPLCANHHIESHATGHDSFDKTYGIDRVKIALSLWNHPGNRQRINYEKKMNLMKGDT